MSQNTIIENYLRKFKRGLTAKEARIRFGCDRLAARINDVKPHFPTVKITEAVRKADGSIAHVARYFAK
jgi:hypothetical protein